MYENLMDSIGFLSKSDAEVGEAMAKELARQKRNLELIASENIVSPEVMAAMGSVLTNKYAEGYPGKRYYGGCECVDIVEDIAIERAKKLFGAKFANVQAHSGAQANTAVYFALLEPGDTVLGMSLAHGGHLTHGSPVNMSGKYFNFVSYGLGDDETIDYDKVEELAKENNIGFAVDVYPHYGSDVETTLRAGNDIRHALIGPGVYASHGYERSHRDGAENTFRLIQAYIG